MQYNEWMNPVRVPLLPDPDSWSWSLNIKSGGGNHNHPGNKVYNKLVSTKRKAFVLAHKDTKAKDAIVQSIYETIRKQSPPGRFLGKNKDGSSYFVKSKEDTFKKIKQALNENRAKIEEYFRLRGQFPPPAKTLKKLTTKSAQPTSKTEKRHKCPSSLETTKTPSLRIVANRQPRQESCKVPTSSDWRKLCSMIDNLDQKEMKEIKRQKLRSIRLTERTSNSNKGKKSSKKESKNTTSVDSLSNTMKSLTLCGKG